MTSTRRDFLQHAALGTIALTGSPALLHADSHRTGSTPSLNLNTTSPLAELINAYQAGRRPPGEWDLSWRERIKGAHRIVFDTPDLDEGSGVYRASMFGGSYKDVLGISDDDISVVLVLRHAAIPLIMSHEFWAEYNLGSKTKMKNPMTGKSTHRNPVLMDVETDGLPPEFAQLSLDKFIQRGGIVLACNQAFGQMVATVRKKHKVSGPEARERALAGVVPGVVLLPTGIVAVQLAEESGCHYQRGS